MRKKRLNDEVMEKMGDAEGHSVTLVYRDGSRLKGIVDVYESRYDNDGEASICFSAEDGRGLIVDEHELSDVIIEDEKETNRLA